MTITWCVLSHFLNLHSFKTYWVLRLGNSGTLTFCTMMKYVLGLLSCLLVTRGALATPTPTTLYANDAFLDEAKDIHMFWNHDDNSITIEIHAKTLGYVAVGFSPTGRMMGADIVIGWVKDGKAILQDRYATGNTKPQMDKKSDTDLFMGKEEDGFTILKFKRKLDTCDPDHDIVIRTGTMKMIWAIGATDPKDDESIYYHKVRGQRNIQLLGVMKKTIQLPANTLSHEFRRTNYTIPSDDTTYACQVLRMPKVNKKHHLVKFEPIISKNNQELVHHILIYACYAPSLINATYEGDQFLCYKDKMPWFRWYCENVLMTWAVGGEAFFFPENVGFSMGTSTDPDFLLMETHYDNPGNKAGQVDDSGIRIYYTPSLRCNDAGILDQGKDTAYNLIVPPKYEAFKSFGVCNVECLNDGIEEAPRKQLNVFAVALHAHKLAVGIKTWQIRDGIELPPIAEDKYYNFDDQTIMTLSEERAIKKGDVIATECTYKTTGRESVTFGGVSSRQEMCISFLYYWPRVSLTKCADRLSEWTLYPFANIMAVDGHGSNGRVTAPAENINKTVREVLNAIDWSDQETRDRFQKYEKYGFKAPVCSFAGKTAGYGSKVFNFTSPTKYYEEPKVNCSKGEGEGQDGNGAGRIGARMLISFVVAMVGMRIRAL